jgi:hypothetical protein
MTDEDLTQAPGPRRDWLLTSARWLVGLIVVLVCVGGLGLLAAAIALPMFEDSLSAEVLAKTGKPFGTELLIAVEFFIAMLMVMGALGFRWLRQLRRIIDSVGLGDAFALVNAERLYNMGWLTVGIELISIPAGAVAHFITTHFERSHIEIGFSLGGILMALVLFILARVFREGAAMREELEGTV